MQYIICIIAKIFRRIQSESIKPLDWIVSFWIFYSNNVQFSTFKNHGWPKVDVGLGGELKIGANFHSNNREMSNPIGRFHACSLVVSNPGRLHIGNNVGMSSAAIVCRHFISIGDNVKLGGGVVIYDTDFHAIDPIQRRDNASDQRATKTAPVIIGNDVFIGAHTTILKGVTIGNNAVIGACSVVTKNIPADEVWAGNPARKISHVSRS